MADHHIIFSSMNRCSAIILGRSNTFQGPIQDLTRHSLFQMQAGRYRLLQLEGGVGACSLLALMSQKVVEAAVAPRTRVVRQARRLASVGMPGGVQ